MCQHQDVLFWHWCQNETSANLGFQVWNLVLELGAQSQNLVNGKIKSRPVPALVHPVPALHAPNWHGADLGTWVFQFRNWMPSPQIGTVPKWGWTYIQGLLFHLYLGIVPTCKVYIDYINHQVRQMLNSSCPPEWLEAKTGLFLK